MQIQAVQVKASSVCVIQALPQGRALHLNVVLSTGELKRGSARCNA